MPIGNKFAPGDYVTIIGNTEYNHFLVTGTLCVVLGGEDTCGREDGLQLDVQVVRPVDSSEDVWIDGNVDFENLQWVREDDLAASVAPPKSLELHDVEAFLNG